MCNTPKDVIIYRTDVLEKLAELSEKYLEDPVVFAEIAIEVFFAESVEKQKEAIYKHTSII